MLNQFTEKKLRGQVRSAVIDQWTCAASFGSITATQARK